MVKEMLNIECYVVMGANIANEVAAESFCEATIGIINVNL
jgi:glycerol-3-phosphate dehydrogenase (NAD+)